LGGFSVDAPGGDDLEVLVAVDDLGGERRHVLVNTTAGRSMSRGSVRFLLSHYGYGRGYYSKAGARRSPLNLVTTHFDLSRNANRRRSDRKRSAKNTVNASFSEEPEEREGCDASGRTDIHPANPESQASSEGICSENESLDTEEIAVRIVLRSAAFAPTGPHGRFAGDKGTYQYLDLSRFSVHAYRYQHDHALAMGVQGKELDHVIVVKRQTS